MIYLYTSVALLSLLGQSGADEAARLILDARATEGLVSSCLLQVETLGRLPPPGGQRPVACRRTDLALTDHPLIPGLVITDRDDPGDRAATVGDRHRHTSGLDLTVNPPGLLIDLPQSHSPTPRRNRGTRCTHDTRIRQRFYMYYLVAVRRRRGRRLQAQRQPPRRYGRKIELSSLT